MTTTFRAAYLPGAFGSNSAGTLLTTEADSQLPDAALIEAAKQTLIRDVNPSLRAIDEPEADPSEIVIGEWRD